MSKNYDKFLELFNSDITNSNELATRLKLSERTIRDYKRKLKNKPTMVSNAKDKKAKKPKLDPIILKSNTLFTTKMFNQVFMKTRYNHCVNLSVNKIEKIYIDGDTEFITRIGGEKFERKITFDVKDLGNNVLEISLFYHLFEKIIRIFKKQKAAKENTTIFACDRNSSISYDNEFWTCRRCTFLNKGIVDKKPFEFREWARRTFKENRTDECTQRWIVYDMETVVDNKGIFVPYMISAVEFYPNDNGDTNENEKLFFTENFSNLFNVDIKVNPVLIEFRNWLLSFITPKEGEDNVFYKNYVFGYNNFRFDDVLLLPCVTDYITTEKGSVDRDDPWYSTFKEKKDRILENIITHEGKDFKHYIGQRNGTTTFSTIEYLPDGKQMERYGKGKKRTENAEDLPRKLEFKDLIKWIPDMSLEKACKAYEIGENSKMNFDILKFNTWLKEVDYNVKSTMKVEDACNRFLKPKKKKKGKIGQEEYDEYSSRPYCKDGMLFPYEMCKEYCMIDSKCTRDLGKKIFVTLKEILQVYCEEFEIKVKSKTMFSYISPADLSYCCFKSSAAFNNGGRRLFINHSNFARFISKSYYGGRTDYSYIGKYTTVGGNLRYYDVTSEYPLAMTKKYPIVQHESDMIVGDDVDLGKYQKIIDKMVQMRRDGRSFVDFTIFRPFDEDFNAIFCCDVFPPEDVTEMITFGPMATRADRVPLTYLNCKQENIVVNTAYMKNFIMAGFSIVLKPNIYNVVFLSLREIFTDFIKFFAGAKTDSKDDANKAKAKLYKLVINSLAGKLAQKPRDQLKEMTTTARDGEELECKLVEDWSKANHYLATFILAEANFILYSTLYKLSLTSIINKVPHSERCGALLYMDTDSIIFDQDLCDDVDFNFTESLGSWNTDTNYFDITWKSKYSEGSPDGMIVIGKKSYLILKNNKQLTIKLKGIHGEQMSKFSSKVDDILDGKSETQKFENMIRKPIKMSNGALHTNKQITLGMVQKTLRVPKFQENRVITCTNTRVNEANKDNTIYFVTSLLPK